MPNQFPRDHRPGDFYSSHRTTRENEELLDPGNRNGNGYALAEAAEATGIRLSVALVLPDVVHHMPLDTAGELSDFWHRCHRTMSVKQQRRLGLVDSIWSSAPPQSMVVDGWEHAVARIVELAVFLVAGGYCDHPREFDGWYGPELWGTEVEFRRPDTFSARSLLPETSTMLLQPPPDRPHDELRRLIAEVAAEIDRALPAARKAAAAVRRERRRRRTTARKGRVQLATLKPAQTRDARRNDRPHTNDYFGPDQNSWRKRREKFRRDYITAKSKFSRDRNVRFPAGTVGFRRLGANCKPFKPYVPPPLLAQPP